MSNESLITYLSDHLAGSTAALELLGDMKTATDAQRASEIESLIGNIELDKGVLEEVLHAAGGKESALKKVGAWAAEKLMLGKFKLGHHADGPLGELEAMETLSLGIAGKAGLWRALAVAGVARGVDLQALQWRAERQREIVENWRIEKAREVLA